MRYLGGKSRIAKEIAAVIAPKGPWWEPFCGGLSVSVQLAKYGPGLVSDACLPLISLYQAVRDGWEPPTSVSESEYRDARSLPDSDPLKAFVGFGCSFGGKWFAGYARDKRKTDDYAGAAYRAVKRDVAALAGCTLARACFSNTTPEQAPASIYCDPPYRGTTGYAGVGTFDHAAFWRRCQEWAARGSDVYVSEYDCPVLSVVAWEKSHVGELRGKDGRRETVERLFRILPAPAQRVA